MNIDDVADQDFPEGSILLAIIAKQTKLMERYHPIEVANGCQLPDEPFNLDDKYCQWRIKHLFWCATEEVGEALEFPVSLHDWRSNYDTDAQLRHFLEELADATHFFAEATIVAGIDVGELNELLSMESDPTMGGAPDRDRLELHCGRFVWAMGLAANCLKNKQWKATHMPTDRAKFSEHMILAWMAWTHIWRSFGADMTDVWQLYAKKNQVNKFRQDTNY